MKKRCFPTILAMFAVPALLLTMTSHAQAQGLGLGAGLGAGLGSQAVLADPFAFYYAIYLPNQQLQAMQPRPLDAINQANVERQYFAQMNRRSLRDPISPYADTYDPLRPFSNQEERIARVAPFQREPMSNGSPAPSLYYNRISQYYPEMASRTGRNKNANVSSRRGRTSIRSRGGRRGGGGMGGGMGGMGMGGMGGMGGGMGGMGMGGMGMF